MTVLEEKELTNEIVLDWYTRAMRNKINIFDDQNKIIAWLARQLLLERGIDTKTYKKT
tara:strand:- start:407 stop:580 length:174 start_codon:yes stop_codon:yes gene_type:complete